MIKKISQKSLYKSKNLLLREDTILLPNKKVSKRPLVILPDSVSILPIDAEGCVYLAREFKYAYQSTTIVAFSGGIQSSETPLTAAKRELAEEAGITAKSWRNIGKIYPLMSSVKISAELFIATDLSFQKSEPEITENLTMLRVPFNKAVSLALEGTIMHAQSSTLILKAALLLKFPQARPSY